MSCSDKLSIVGIIPARGGSKEIAHKNIYPVNGRPLIYYTINAAIKSKYIIDTYVSSEDKEILEISLKYGAKVLERPMDLALDDTSTELVIKDAINRLKDKGCEYNLLIVLQPTSPLRGSDDIDNAVTYLIDKNATALISVCEPIHHPLKSFKLTTQGFLTGMVNNKYPFMRRQDLPKAYLPNGAIYMVYTYNFFLDNSFITDKTVPYLMSNRNSVDIDRLEDILLVENIMRKSIQ